MSKKPSARRTVRAMGKSAGQRIAAATTSARKRVGKTAALVSDLNKDGKIDSEDAKIATATAKRITSKVSEGVGTLAKKAAKHDMVKDAAAGAAIGAAVAIPVPIVGPAAGAAIGAIVGVAKNLRAPTEPEALGKGPKASTVKAAKRSVRGSR
jgi:vacuolar-type H+-ATPase subunit H